MNLPETVRKFVQSTEIPRESAGEGIRRQILSYDSQLMLVKVEFEKGAVGAPHHHVHRQLSYVESGRFEVEIDSEKSILTEGDTFLVEPDLLHGVKALEAGVLIDVFTPAREDFL